MLLLQWNIFDFVAVFLESLRLPEFLKIIVYISTLSGLSFILVPSLLVAAIILQIVYPSPNRVRIANAASICVLIWQCGVVLWSILYENG